MKAKTDQSYPHIHKVKSQTKMYYVKECCLEQEEREGEKAFNDHHNRSRKEAKNARFSPPKGSGVGRRDGQKVKEMCSEVV